MKSVNLTGSARSTVGSKDAKALRREGLVPCVIYGGEQQTHIALNTKEVEKLLSTPEAFKLEIDVDGKTFTAILKDVQFHPLTDEILHADLLELIDNKKVVCQIPVQLVGTSIGVRNGGKLNLNRRKLMVKAFPKDLPDFITIDISKLRIGQSIRIGDVATENFELVNPDKLVIVAVNRTRGAVDVDEEEEEGEEGEEGAEASAEGAEAAAE